MIDKDWLNETVVNPIAHIYEVEPEAIIAQSKRPQVCKARHCIYHFLYTEKPFSYRQIANAFGVDHFSVQYGVKAHVKRLSGTSGR